MDPLNLASRVEDLRKELASKRKRFRQSRERTRMEHIERSDVRQETLLLFDTLRRHESISDVRPSSIVLSRELDTSLSRMLHKSMLASATREDWWNATSIMNAPI